jgi:hypothetical protein
MIDTEFSSEALTIEELIDLVQDELTFSRAMPCILKDEEIRRLAEKRVSPWFYRNYHYATEKAYFGVKKNSFRHHKNGMWYVKMPNEVQYCTWIYQVGDARRFGFGFASDKLGEDVGYSLGSASGAGGNSGGGMNMTTMGDFAVFRLVVEGFADVLNKMNKSTFKHSYNPNQKVLSIMSRMNKDLVVEAYANIEPEYLYGDPLFQEYLIGMAMEQMGRQIKFFDMPLIGDVKVDGAAIATDGKERKDKAIEEVKKLSSSAGFFRMT